MLITDTMATHATDGWMAWNASVINATKQLSKKKETTLFFVQPRISSLLCAFVSYILVAPF